MDLTAIVESLFKPAVAFVIFSVAFVVYEYSRPEIAYYRLGLEEGKSPGVVRYFVTSFERIAVRGKFAVALYVHGGKILSDCVSKVSVRAGPWFSELKELDGGVQIFFDGIPAGGVFLVEVHLNERFDESFELGMDAVEPVGISPERRPLLSSEHVGVGPRGFRKLDHDYVGPFVRFYVQVVVGLIVGLGVYFLGIVFTQRTLPTLPQSVSPAWMEILLLVPILLVTLVYYMARRGTSASDGMGREFACAYHNSREWAPSSPKDNHAGQGGIT